MFTFCDNSATFFLFLGAKSCGGHRGINSNFSHLENVTFFSLLAGSSHYLIISEAAFNADFTLAEGT